MNNIVQMPTRHMSYPFPMESDLYFPVVERRNGWENKQNGSWLNIDEEKSLIRTSEDGTMQPVWLANVGKGYKVIQNKELFRHAEAELITSLPSDKLSGVEVTDAMSYRGRWCMRDYRFPAIEVRLGDPGNPSAIVNFRFTVINGFGAASIRLLVGAYDLICTNGMIIGMAERVVKRHTSGLQIPGITKYITDGLDLFWRDTEQWSKWINKEISDDDVDRLLSDLPISDLRRRILMDRWITERNSRGNNVWALYSAMTYFASHGDVRRTGQDNTESTRVTRQLDAVAWSRHPAFQRLAA